jgi:formate hydrogenlyase subunit 6/NADH:ubiquinone oxidoreductase subunit I
VDDMSARKTTYWNNFGEAFSTLKNGLKLTWRHAVKARKSKRAIGVEHPDYFKFEEGIITLQYPHQQIPVPDIGRYKLHNEIDDCIVCDKCAKVCPVDCIDIEPIRSAEEFGLTSDGTSKRIYAAKFDIDMSKCCFCGLCTTVCPTECLTMTPEYDFSTFDLAEHNFLFGEMTPLDILEKKQAWEKYQSEKEAKILKEKENAPSPEAAIPIFKPKMPMMKPKMESSENISTETPKPETDQEKPIAAKPVFKPKMPAPKPIIKPKEEE